jgi:hypothetical protein
MVLLMASAHLREQESHITLESSDQVETQYSVLVKSLDF